MAPLVSPLIRAVRSVRAGRPLDDCKVCGRAVRPGDARMRLPGGGLVHSGCTTYRMRQRERIRRTLAAGF
jgi:hypothetical protein